MVKLEIPKDWILIDPKIWEVGSVMPPMYIPDDEKPEVELNPKWSGPSWFLFDTDVDAIHFKLKYL